MKNALATYLADHLAGATHAIALLSDLRDEYRSDELGTFAADLLRELQADKATLEQIAERAGEGPSELKEIGAKLGEKLSRFKFRHGERYGLGTFEALEHLGIGIQGKVALWRALALLATHNASLSGYDFDDLLRRGTDQHERVERWRLTVAEHSFANT
jgi:hypothetical protein